MKSDHHVIILNATLALHPHSLRLARRHLHHAEEDSVLNQALHNLCSVNVVLENSLVRDALALGRGLRK